MEFALVLPVLLVLLLGIADFGRAFAAGIILEASARNAAEAAAQEYLQVARNAPDMDVADYLRIHRVAEVEACREAERLPEELDSNNDGVCEMPFVAVCVHDLPASVDDASPPPGDGSCGVEAANAPSPGCSRMTDDAADPSDSGDAWTPTKKTVDGYDPAEALAYVEVRVCYRFRTIFDLSGLQLPFSFGLSLGDIWLQRDRSFTVADY